MHILVLHPVSAWHLERVVRATRKHGGLVSIVTIAESHVGEGMQHIEEWLRVDSLTDDPDSLLRILPRQYTAILAGNEFAVVAADRLAEAMGLYHNDVMNIARSRNKDKMREAFTEGKIPQPKMLARIQTAEDVDSLLLSDDSFPVIAKPINMAMSLFVRLCYSKAEIKTAVQEMAGFEKSRLTNYRFERGALVEEFAGGQEYSYEAVIESGRSVAGFVTKKFLSPSPSFYEIAHLSGLWLGEEIENTLEDIAEKIASVWGMHYGVMHLEFKLDNAQVKVIEAGARPAGDLIPELIDLKYGFSLEEALVLCRHGRSCVRPSKELEREGYVGIRFEFAERTPFAPCDAINVIRDSRDTLVTNPNADSFSTNRRTGYVIVEAKSISFAHGCLVSI